MLGCLQVSDLYQNCLKLASENKINKNNTWSLGLIDHLSDLVRPADSEGRSTNFQVGPRSDGVMCQPALRVCSESSCARMGTCNGMRLGCPLSDPEDHKGGAHPFAAGP